MSGQLCGLLQMPSSGHLQSKRSAHVVQDGTINSLQSLQKGKLVFMNGMCWTGFLIRSFCSGEISKWRHATREQRCRIRHKSLDAIPTRNLQKPRAIHMSKIQILSGRPKGYRAPQHNRPFKQFNTCQIGRSIEMHVLLTFLRIWEAGDQLAHIIGTDV